MDISEMIPYVRAAALMAGAWAVFLLAARLRRDWIRMPVRAAAALGVFLGFLALLMMAGIGEASIVRTPVSPSPDGSHVALLTYNCQGALGGCGGHVSVRRRGSPFATKVFVGASYASNFGTAFQSPVVKWLDHARLEIRYNDPRVYQNRCGQRVDGIEIVCVKLPPSSS